MKREIKVVLDLTDEQLARIVPSGRVFVTIDSDRGIVSGKGEILYVKDVNSGLYDGGYRRTNPNVEYYDVPGEPVNRYPGEL